MASAVVGLLPLRIDDRTSPNFDDAVAGPKARVNGSLDQLNVRPLVLVMVDIISNLAEQNPLVFQDAVSFSDERGVGMGEGVALFLRGFSAQPEALMKILLLVSPLVWDVRRIVNHYVKKTVLEWCGSVVCDN